MIIMKKLSFFAILLVSVLSCSPYNVKTEVESSSDLSQLKSSGIIFRYYKNSIIELHDYSSNFRKWLEGHKKINKIILLPDVSSKAEVFDSTFNRFYQHSINDNFLKYKTIGIIKLYVRENELELKKLMKEKGLDSIVVYEINSGFSKEMQIFDMETVVIVLNSNLQLIYLDHQRDSYPEKKIPWDTMISGDVKGDYDNFTEDMLKKALLDKISQRFIEVLLDIDFIEEID